MADTFGPVTGHTFLAWIETQDGLVAIDSGWDVADGEPYEGSDIEALENAAAQTGKPLTHILFTHDHPDHCANLPLWRERYPNIIVMAHENTSIPDVTQTLKGGETLTLGGVTIQVIFTPGHSQHRDEICYYLPDYRFLFCGDVVQPNGPSYAVSDDWSPVPFFYYGDEYRRSLERLIALDVAHMRTGHGDFMAQEQARQWLRVTLTVVLRIEELAVTYTERYPTKPAEWIAELIFDQIAEERHYGTKNVRARKANHTRPEVTDYVYFDLPGILYFVQQATEVSG